MALLIAHHFVRQQQQRDMSSVHLVHSTFCTVCMVIVLSSKFLHSNGSSIANLLGAHLGGGRRIKIYNSGGK